MGGVLLQWGSVDYNSNNLVTITFPNKFANIYSVTATVDAGDNSGSGVNIAGTAIFEGDVTSKIRWMALGN